MDPICLNELAIRMQWIFINLKCTLKPCQSAVVKTKKTNQMSSFSFYVNPLECLFTVQALYRIAWDWG